MVQFRFHTFESVHNLLVMLLLFVYHAVLRAHRLHRHLVIMIIIQLLILISHFLFLIARIVLWFVDIDQLNMTLIINSLLFLATEVQTWFGAKHDRHTHYYCKEQKESIIVHLILSLTYYWLPWLFGVVISKCKYWCDNDADDTWCLFILQLSDTSSILYFWTIVNIMSFEKFYKNQSIHPSEKAP